jgi:hypothetical protein
MVKNMFQSPYGDYLTFFKTLGTYVTRFNKMFQSLSGDWVIFSSNI